MQVLNTQHTLATSQGRPMVVQQSLHTGQA